MTTAESGTHDNITSPKEQTRMWNNWKRFLDLELIGMLKSRTPVLTRYLSFTHQYDFCSHQYNNTYCRTMSIDYFRQVKHHCKQYASNHQYYLYTLQCYEHLATLYQHSHDRSIEYYQNSFNYASNSVQTIWKI
ncbi:unnamed protein product [Rotaria sp. Silwood2]|nr:unnamed protein product [Rotaria sp. Silwood2]CAF3297018.1 unnamed protein product [Rotaria sp. Silwood2]CAF4613019.1 unnamed protein product [Rotaria sp. Silwood2]CAF4744316.1 unnamed protein product [Rotaria sp. Silwood2]